MIKRYVVLELRACANYYSYTLYLIDMKRETVIDKEGFGEMICWEIEDDFKPFITAYSELLKRNNLSYSDVKYVSIFNQKITNDEWRKLVDIALRGE